MPSATCEKHIEFKLKSQVVKIFQILYFLWKGLPTIGLLLLNENKLQKPRQGTNLSSTYCQKCRLYSWNLWIKNHNIPSEFSGSSSWLCNQRTITWDFWQAKRQKRNYWICCRNFYMITKDIMLLTNKKLRFRAEMIPSSS